MDNIQAGVNIRANGLSIFGVSTISKNAGCKQFGNSVIESD